MRLQWEKDRAGNNAAPARQHAKAATPPAALPIQRRHCAAAKADREAEKKGFVAKGDIEAPRGALRERHRL